MKSLRKISGGVASVCCAIALASCVSFVPTYDAVLFKHLEAVSDDLSKVEGAVGDVYPTSTPFEKVEGLYVDAFGNLVEAEKIVSGQRAFYRDRLADAAVSELQQAIQNCRQALTEQMTKHRAAPMTKAFMETLAAQNACKVATTMQGLLKEEK